MGKMSTSIRDHLASLGYTLGLGGISIASFVSAFAGAAYAAQNPDGAGIAIGTIGGLAGVTSGIAFPVLGYLDGERLLSKFNCKADKAGAVAGITLAFGLAALTVTQCEDLYQNFLRTSPGNMITLDQITLPVLIGQS